MMIKIGSMIKQLRTQNNLTQDTLACALGVTPQAISRWEAEGGYPDIELLPAIADFFSVSIDELLGYKLSGREANLVQTKAEMKRLAEVGTLEERIAFVRSALSKYPADCEIKGHLAVCLYFLYTETEGKNKNLLTEAENLARYVADHSKDEDIRYDAINTLISIYAALNDTQKVLETVNLLSPMKYCREFAKSYGIGDGKNELYKQDAINQLTDRLGNTITELVLDNELPNDSSSWDKKIQMLKTANQLYLLIYGENLFYYHSRLALNYWLISTYQIAQGNTNEALTSLENMCHHSILYDQAYANDHRKQYTSVLVDKITYGNADQEINEHSQSWYMLDRLQDDRYNTLRTEKRFVEIEKALKEYAR